MTDLIMHPAWQTLGALLFLNVLGTVAWAVWSGSRKQESH